MSEINDIEELSEGNFPINLKLIQKYQQWEPSILAKYKTGTYHKGYFFWGSNMDRTEAIIFQHLYWPNIIYAAQKELTNGDTCQRTKLLKKWLITT